MNISIKNLSFAYGDFTVVNDISFDVRAGEVLSIIGPNGSGKSTLLKCLARIFKPKTGHILLNGNDAANVDVKDVAKLIGYVPQRGLGTFSMTVLESVLLGRKPHISWKVQPKDLDAVQQALDAMHLNNISQRSTEELSGGQRQIVEIARAMAQQPELFLFDEPTNNLDIKAQLNVLGIARAIARQRDASVIMVLHDLNQALWFSDTVLMMNKNGALFEYGVPRDVLTTDNIFNVYGVRTTLVDGEDGSYIIPVMSAK